MKNYLIAIDNEIKEFYSKYIKDIDDIGFELAVEEFCDNSIAIFDYYTEHIYTNGKMSVYKKLGLPVQKKPFINEDLEFIKNYKLNNLGELNSTLQTAIINCYEYRDSDVSFYEDIIEIIIGKCLKLFKQSQLMEYKIQNIDKVNLISDINNSCAICQTLSKFTHNTNDLINNIDNLHPYCKLSIEPAVNINDINFTVDKTQIGFLNLPVNLQDSINAVLMQLKIYCKDKITDKTFIIVDNINNENDFNNLLKSKYTEDKINELKIDINNTIGYFEYNNKVLISKNNLTKLSYFIVRGLLKEKLFNIDLTWWKEEYYNRQKEKYILDDIAIYVKPFISFLAEQNYESYFLESAIHFILNPKFLKDIDCDCYNKLKYEVFNNIEFIRGK